MKKFLLIYSTFILPLLSFSQVQITDFKNIEATSPSNFQFIDTLNNRLLFSTFAAEQIKQYTLWTTDGTVENTKKLVDEKGENPSNFFYGKIKLGRNLYIKDDGIWKTDGQNLHSIVDYSDSLRSFYKVGDKILVHFQAVIYKNLGGVILKDYLYWLDSNDKLSFFEKDITSFKVVNNELHYIKLNDSTKKWELYRYSSNTKELLASVGYSSGEPARFDLFTYEGIDHYFLEIPTQSVLISVNRFSKSTDIKEWGDESSANYPLIIRDTLNNPYIFRVNSAVKIFSLQKESHLNLIAEASWNDVFNTMFKQSVEPSNYGWGITQIRLLGNKLIFVIYKGGEGLYAYHLNEYDFTTKKARVSKNLKIQLSLNDANRPTVKPLGNDEYEIDNSFGKIFRYSFNKDTAVWASSYQYPPKSKPDSGFIVNNTKLLLRGSLYKIIGKDTISMIPQKKIFSPYNSFGTNFLSKQLNNKLLFWFYDETTKQNQLWVSNGEKGGSEKLMSFTDSFQSNKDDVKVIDGKAHFYSTNNSELSIYITDGTTIGTRKIWQSDGLTYLYVDKILTTDHQIVYFFSDFNSSGISTKKIVVISDGKATEIENIPTSKDGFNMISTSVNFYLVTTHGRINGPTYNVLYKLQNNTFKQIDIGIGEYIVFQNRVYYKTLGYGSNKTGLYYADESVEAEYVSDKDKGAYNIYENKLVYTESEQKKNGNIITYTIFDLPSNKIETTFSYTPYYAYTTLNIQKLSDSILIFSDSQKIIIIKNREKKEFDFQYPIYVRPFEKGILVQEASNHTSYGKINLTFIDLSNFVITPILKNISYQGIVHNPNAQFILILFAQDSNKVIWKQWNNNTQQLQDLEGDFREINCNSVIERKKTNDIFWTFDGQKLNKSYEIYDFAYRYLRRQNTFFNTKNGNIITLGKDSVITLARMTNENEGFNIYDIFQFNKQLYAYTFTYNEGYQVWKLPPLTEQKLNQFSQSCSPLMNSITALSTEEESIELEVFPNPTSQTIFVDIAESADFQIIDIKGSVLMNGKVSSSEPINVSVLQPNIYFIRLRHHNLSLTKRFVKF